MGLPEIIVLIGLRGSGKSTVARELGAMLRRDVVDLDEVTARELGAESAGDGLREHGEPAFRAAEARALEATLARTGIVLALGGGTPTHAASAALLRDAQVAGRAYLIYLQASVETLVARLADTDAAARPSLTGKAMPEEVAELHAVRDPVYAGMVQSIIAVDGQSLDDTVSAVLNAVPRDSI